MSRTDRRSAGINETRLEVQQRVHLVVHIVLSLNAWGELILTQHSWEVSRVRVLDKRLSYDGSATRLEPVVRQAEASGKSHSLFR